MAPFRNIFLLALIVLIVVTIATDAAKGKKKKAAAKRAAAERAAAASAASAGVHKGSDNHVHNGHNHGSNQVNHAHKGHNHVSNGEYIEDHMEFDETDTSNYLDDVADLSKMFVGPVDDAIRSHEEKSSAFPSEYDEFIPQPAASKKRKNGKRTTTANNTQSQPKKLHGRGAHQQG